MRVCVAAIAMLATLAGCRTAEPSKRVEPTRSASNDFTTLGDTPAASSPEGIAAKVEPGSTPPSPAAAAMPKPQGYVLVYPGSQRVGAKDETTEGNGERNRILYRTTTDSLEKVAAFYIDQLGVQETLSLADRKILTGPLPGGGRVAITLTKEKATHIEVVAVTPL